MEREAIAIDIGGTWIKLGRVTDQGRVVERARIDAPIDLPGEAAVARISAAGRRLMAGGSPCVAGVGCAGLIDSGRGLVHTSPNLPNWHDLSVGALLGEGLGLPVAVTNDANAFALAEARLGAARGHRVVVAVTLGTGVGGAIVVDGRVFGGQHGFAGEIGHLSVDVAEGLPCPCGNVGCLELCVGRRGISAAYLERAAWRPGVPGYELAGGDRAVLDPRIVAEAAAQGDEAAIAALAQVGGLLGAALAGVCNVIDPSIFVVGGGVAQAGDLILEPARRALAERAMARAVRVPPLLPATLGVDAGLIGAGLFGFDALGGGCCG